MKFRCRTVKKVCVDYGAPVTNSMRLLRAFPPHRRGAQSVESLDWRCDPKESTFGVRTDDFGNQILGLSHHQIPGRFIFEMELVTAHESTLEGVSQETGLSKARLQPFLMPSALADFNGVMLPMARALEGQPISEICAAVYELLKYEPGNTFVDTPASTALAQQTGVCQDFAHLMIAFCRSLKIPARYVSGYCPGEGAMHAWVEVLQNNIWESWDPTHNQRTLPECVFVAAGRDFRDVAPLTGSYHGPPNPKLEVHCVTTIL